MFNDDDMAALIQATTFAANKHRDQRRKGNGRIPYINHPIHVLQLLWDVGAIRDLATLVAALLHDTLEDTATSPDEIERIFGAEVLGIVLEVTDDKSLPKHERKRLQIEHAPLLSIKAKVVKLADKIANVNDLAFDTPVDWSHARLVAYIEWAVQVVDGMRGANVGLEEWFDQVVAQAKTHLNEAH